MENISPKRLSASQYMARPRYSYGTLFTPALLGEAWGEMFHVYQFHVENGVRSILQVGKKGITIDGRWGNCCDAGPFW